MSELGRREAIVEHHRVGMHRKHVDVFEMVFPDRRTTLERCLDSLKQTFTSSSATVAEDDHRNFLQKKKPQLSAILNEFRRRRIECIDSETEENNLPVDLNQKLPSAKLATSQPPMALTTTPAWDFFGRGQLTDVENESSGGIVDMPATDPDHDFPRLFKYMSLMPGLVPWMIPNSFHVDQDPDPAAENLPMPTLSDFLGNSISPHSLIILRSLSVSEPQTLPPRRAREKQVTEGDAPGDCPICLQEIELGSTVIYLGCEHCFHKECIYRWLEEKTTCPVCRNQSTMITDD